jgi:hypothetical protein
VTPAQWARVLRAGAKAVPAVPIGQGQALWAALDAMATEAGRIAQEQQ